MMVHTLWSTTLDLLLQKWGMSWLTYYGPVTWHRSGSTLVQVLACCLTVPSHLPRLMFTSLHRCSVEITYSQESSINLMGYMCSFKITITQPVANEFLGLSCHDKCTGCVSFTLCYYKTLYMFHYRTYRYNPNAPSSKYIKYLLWVVSPFNFVGVNVLLHTIHQIYNMKSIILVAGSGQSTLPRS